MRPETLAIHAGGGVDAATGAVTAPIPVSTIFERDEDGAYRRGFSYTRRANPNRLGLERCLAALEGGAAAVAFASGSAAESALFQALGRSAHVIAPADAYYGTRLILNEICEPWGLSASFVDITDAGAVRAALRKDSKLIWVETPSNPLMRVADISALAALAHEAGALCAVDNTLATPVLQRPLDHGADIAVHATTKYLGGHSDVLGGAVVFKAEEDLYARVAAIAHVAGAVPSPFECWLALRGVKTLPYRMRAHSSNALCLAKFLDEHEAVEAVHYPGLHDDPGHALALRQMNSFSGVLSFRVHGGAQRALQVAAQAKLFTRATSFGGVESLIEHRASIEGPGSPVPQNLLRLSVGLEHPQDLIEDLAQALAAG